MLKYLTSVLMCVIFNFCAYSADQLPILIAQIDSMEKDSLQVALHINISKEYGISNYVKSLKHAEKALNISEEINYHRGIIKSAIQQGSIFIDNGFSKLALSKLKYALELSKKHKYKELEGETLKLLGTLNYYAKDYNQSLRYYSEYQQISVVILKLYITIAHVHKRNSLPM